MPTASGRTVTLMGNHVEGNVEENIYESGKTYDLDFDTITTYTNEMGQLPYEVYS